MLGNTGRLVEFEEVESDNVLFSKLKCCIRKHILNAVLIAKDLLQNTNNRILLEHYCVL